MGQYQNLALYSQQFTNAAWAANTTGMTFLNNQVMSPDGTIDASSAGFTAATSYFYQTVNIPTSSSATYTFSIYAYSINKTDIGIKIYNSSLSIQLTQACALTSGWQRYSISITPKIGDTSVSFGLDNRVANQGDGAAGTVYVWGGQLVQANWAGPYIATTATAVNNGPIRSIAPQTQNLLKYSEDFTQSGTWIQKNLASVAANQIANPRNGAVNVSGLIGTNVSITHYVYQAITYTLGLTYTFSVYAKAGNQNWLLMEGDGGVFCYFNITAGSGAVGTAAGVTGHIQALSNGWYLCSITYVPYSASANALLFSTPANGSVTFTGGGTTVDTYLFGAMITQTSGLTGYTPTTNAIVSGGSMRQLVPQAQNLLTYSQAFDNAAWSLKMNVSITAAATTAPDGTMTGEAYVESTSTNVNHQLGLTNSGYINGPIYTASVYLKAGARNYAILTTNAAPSIAMNVDLTSGVVGITPASSAYSANVIGYGSTSVGNGWYRVWISYACNISGAFPLIIQSQLLTGQNQNTAYTGTSSTVAIYVWGAQLTIGNNPGPYQVTTATAVNTGPIRSIAPQSQNLLTYSEQFNQAGSWTPTNLTLVSNAIANPVNGATTASSFTDTSDGGATSHILTAVSTPEVGKSTYTFSVYAKAGSGGQWFGLLPDAGGYASYFDVLNGVLGTIGGLSSSISPLRNGWYRCSITYVSFGAGFANRIYMCNANGSLSYQGAANKTLYWYGAQVVQANQPGPYQLTTATAVNNIPIRSVAPQTQNLFLNSQVFTGNTLTNISIASNTADTLDPFGGNNASKLTDNSTNGLHRFFQAFISANSKGYAITQSIYAKAGTITFLEMEYNDDFGITCAYFNLSNGTVSNLGTSVLSASATAVGNGWYRCSVTTINPLSTTLSMSFNMASAAGTDSYAGTSQSCYVFGAQVVQANRPGSYALTNSIAVNTGAMRNSI